MTQAASSTPSNHLASAITTAIAANRLAADGRAVRRDGWTPERIRLFLETLADRASITTAARAAGVSTRAAYKFRDRAPAFDDAWQIALGIACPIRPLVSRVLHGSVKTIVRNGRIRGERHYFDNRLAMAMLTRLDRQILSRQAGNEPLVAMDFDSLVALACAQVALPRGARSRGDTKSCEPSASRPQKDRGPQPHETVTATAAAEPSLHRAWDVSIL
jgi:hypothetical protein